MYWYRNASTNGPLDKCTYRICTTAAILDEVILIVMIDQQGKLYSLVKGATQISNYSSRWYLARNKTKLLLLKCDHPRKVANSVPNVHSSHWLFKYLNDLLDQQQLSAWAQDSCSWRKLVVAYFCSQTMMMTIQGNLFIIFDILTVLILFLYLINFYFSNFECVIMLCCLQYLCYGTRYETLYSPSLERNHMMIHNKLVLQGFTFNENNRIDSHNIQIRESISLIESYSKRCSFSEIWFLQTGTKVNLLYLPELGLKD